MRYLSKVFCLGFREAEGDRKEERGGVKESGREEADAVSCGAGARLVGDGGVATAVAPASARGTSGGGEKKRKRGVTFLLVGGLLGLVCGCLSMVWTPYDLFIALRLRMTPGFPPYDWWVSPPDEVFLRVYVFNITNGEEFLSGAHSKLRFQEVGPFVFQEKLYHENVTFNGNGTLTYTARRKPIFLPELTSISLNATVVVPNLAMLGMASHLYDAAFFTKFGYNMLARRVGSSLLNTLSVNDYFWNYSDPLVHLARKMIPNIVPFDNMGILHTIYRDFVDEVTVYIGPENAPRFFTMDRYHGSPRFGYWQNETCDSVYGATEGLSYHHSITRNDSLNYLRKTICRVAPIFHVADVLKDGLNAMRFELPEDFFDRTEDPETDCFIGKQDSPLASGLSDLAPCYYGFPFAASAPHFCDGDPSLIDAVEGMTPQRNKHVSYVIVEPNTGVPLESCARIQSNLVVREISSMSSLNRFSNIVIPMFWAEYHQVGIPSYVYYLLYFLVVILPDLQTCLSFLAVAIGGLLLIIGVAFLTCKNEKNKKLRSYSSLDFTTSTSSSSC